MRALRRLRNLILHRRYERELAEEMEFHRALSERAGDTEPAMGNMTYMKEESRAVWIPPSLESIVQDVRYAVRYLFREPGFAAVAVTGLALGIGLNTSIFTLINAVALRAWPVRDAGRMAAVYMADDKGAGGFPLAETRYFAQHARTFSGLVASREMAVRLSGDTSDKSLAAVTTTGNYFDVLGIAMQLGRGFHTEEDALENPKAVAVLSYAAWQGRFGSDPEIAGKQIRLDEIPYTVVGVAAREFTGTSMGRVDLWIPFSSMQLLRPLDPSVPRLLREPSYCCSAVAGRLGPSITREHAQAELEVLHRQFLESNRSPTNGSNRRVTITDTAFLSHPGTVRKAGPVLALVFGGVTLVLLLACANVGNLLLARAAARRREIGVRLSLGAGRWRVVRQLLTESLLLALIAGAIGIALAFVLPGMVANATGGEEMAGRLVPDRLVLLYTFAVSILSCVAFGLAPALHGTRVQLADALKVREALVGRISLRGLLLFVQVAISVVLLSSAGLLLRGVQRVARQDPGFEVNGVSSVTISWPVNAYDDERRRGMVARLRNELPGVAFTLQAPLDSSRWYASVRRPDEESRKARLFVNHVVTPEYFDVLKVPVVTGRYFLRGDDGRSVVLVNEAAANRLWPGENPLGKILIQGDPGEPHEVTGVVKDVHTTSLDEIEPAAYRPFRDAAATKLLVRSDRSGGTDAVAAVIKRLEPRAHVGVVPLAANLERYLKPARTGAAMAAALGAVALILATIGLFGVFGFVVEQRTKEIGIRTALGAQPGAVVRQVLGASAGSVLMGLVVGFAAAIAASRLLRGLIHGVETVDFAAYGGVAIILGLAGMVASYVPARRAARIDPVRALRHS
jgi:predicted permease